MSGPIRGDRCTVQGDPAVYRVLHQLGGVAVLWHPSWPEAANIKVPFHELASINGLECSFPEPKKANKARAKKKSVLSFLGEQS